MMNPSDAKRDLSHTWNLLQVKVCTFRGCLTLKATCQELSQYLTADSMHPLESLKMKAICPSLIEISYYVGN
jgi:hypothetical protein